MSIYDELNERQQEAVFQVDGPVLILAGAGSGKTSVITHRIAYLIDEAGVNPYNILAITFTNKAANEMRERVDKLVGFGSEAIHVSTFHSMCVRILRRYAEFLGYDSNFTIYDTDDQKQVVKEACKKLQIDTKYIKEREIMNAISSCKDELITPEEYVISTMGDFNKRKIANVYVEYQAILKKNNAMDFDDLLMKTVELFKANPEILKNYQMRWQYIMVDEYQDTNTAQFELIRLMASATRNLCVVGDDDQSIYKFRGANIRNILDFERYYPEAKVIKLEQNYRSVQNILEAANCVIRNNASRKNKSLWSAKEKGEKIHFRQLESGYEEAEYVVMEIKRSIRNGESTPKENAILYRTNAQSRAMEEKLVNENMPYCIVGGVNFYSRREIKDLIAYLKTVDNGRDDLAVRRIINVPKRGIGNTTIQKIQEVADYHSVSFFEAMMHEEWLNFKGAAAEKIHNFVNMILSFRARLEILGLERLLQEILDVTDYINQMDVETEEEAEDRIANIEELQNKVSIYVEESEHPQLSELLEEIALVADIDNVTDADERTLLMTIHSAKGLEFKNVYLIGMEDGLFPSYMSIQGGDVEIEEERRLAYVGITRAKERLTLTSARARMVRGETQVNPISRFVREIPNELFDIAPLPAKKKYDPYDDYGDYDDKGFSGFSRKIDTSSYKPYSFSRAADKIIDDSEMSTPKLRFVDKDDKPFIARKEMLGTLTKGADIQKGTLGYGVGDRVKHIKFGEGTVLKIEKETRDDKVTVQFDSYGVKIMYASFAKLVKI